MLATCGLRLTIEAFEDTYHTSCSLPIPKRKSTISSIYLLIFTKGNVHGAWDSHLFQAVDRSLSSVAPPPVLATQHVRSQKRQCSPSNVAGAIRLFPPSYLGLRSLQEGHGCPDHEDFPSVLQVQSALCPGVTGPHLLCYCVSVRRCSAGLIPQLATSIPEPGSKHDRRPYHIDSTVECAGGALLPAWLPFAS